MMVDGNLIVYQGDKSEITVDITTDKCLWNSIISTENSRSMCMDVNITTS